MQEIKPKLRCERCMSDCSRLFPVVLTVDHTDDKVIKKICPECLDEHEWKKQGG